MAYNRQDFERSQQKERLQALFDSTLLEHGYITQFDVNLLDNVVSIMARVPLSEDEILEHRVVFSGVRALLYQNELFFPLENIRDDPFPAPGVVWSWAGYNFYDRSVVVRVVDPPRGLETVAGVSMNFVLDLMMSNGVLLIAAKGVSIDDEYFDVGLPPAP